MSISQIIEGCAKGELRKDCDQLLKIGSPTIPVAIKSLSHSDPRVRKFSMTYLYSNLSYNPVVLTDIKPDIEKLVATLHPILMEKFDDDSEDVRRRAPPLLTLIAIQSGNKAIQSKIISSQIEALMNDNDNIRIGAARTIAKLSEHFEVPINPILGGMKDQNSEVRQLMARSIASMYGNGKMRLEDFQDAIPILKRALEDRDQNVRHWVAIALESIDPDSEEAIPFLVECFQSEDDYVISDAFRTLQIMGPRAKSAIPALEQLLDHPKYRIRAVAELTLKAIKSKRLH